MSRPAPSLAELIAANSNALAKKNGLEVKISSAAEYNNAALLPVINNSWLTNLNIDKKSANLQRAEADLWALAHRFSAPLLHQQNRPNTKESANCFDRLEAMRLELLIQENYAGVAKNLNELMQKHCENIALESTPPWAEILALLLRKKVLQITTPNHINPLLDFFAPQINEKAQDLLQKMADNLRVQADFAQYAIALIDYLSSAQQPEKGDAEAPQAADAPTDENKDEQQDDLQADNDKTEKSADSAESTQQILGSTEEDLSSKELEKLVVLTPELSDISEELAVNYKNIVDNYHVFTNKYDEIIPAHKLASPEELLRLRGQLDLKLTEVRGSFSKLAAALQRVLMAQQRRQWEFDLETGRLNSARLARMVANPTQRLIFKQEKERNFRDTIITLLLDNSGSMRGRPITLAALSADILAKTLERAGIKIEILGFTTQDWKGGKSNKEWQAAGKPANPGRLNDLRHIIYKAADTPLVRARRNLGLMLKDTLLKENIDGEALLWAVSRLQARPETRKILMVISDGAPVDDATLSSNNSGFLDRHLRETIKKIEKDKEIELVAIGIGHDVTRYYQRSVTIRDASRLGETMTRELVALFADKNAKL